MLRRGRLQHAETTGLGINELPRLAERADSAVDKTPIPNSARGLGAAFVSISRAWPLRSAIVLAVTVLRVACAPPDGVQLVGWCRGCRGHLWGPWLGSEAYDTVFGCRSWLESNWSQSDAGMVPPRVSGAS